MFKFLVFASLSLLVAQSALSSSSVKNLKSGYVAFNRIGAEYYSHSTGPAGISACGVLELGYNNPGSYAAYSGVDFEDGAELVTFRLRGGRTDYVVGYVELRLGSATAEIAATFPVSTTGTSVNCNYVNVTIFLPAIISGVQDLYLTFDSPDGASVVNIDWFQFTKKYPKTIRKS